MKILNDFLKQKPLFCLQVAWQNIGFFVCSLVFCFSLLSSISHADIVKLIEAKQVEGYVVSTLDGKMFVETDSGTVVIDKKDIESIEKKEWKRPENKNYINKLKTKVSDKERRLVDIVLFAVGLLLYTILVYLLFGTLEKVRSIITSLLFCCASIIIFHISRIFLFSFAYFAIAHAIITRFIYGCSWGRSFFYGAFFSLIISISGLFFFDIRF